MTHEDAAELLTYLEARTVTAAEVEAWDAALLAYLQELEVGGANYFGLEAPA